MKKKILFIMLGIMVCVNGMYAQTSDEPKINTVAPQVSEDEDSLVAEAPRFDADDEPEADDAPKARTAKPKHKKVAQTRDNMEELKELLREFNKNALAESQQEQPDYDNMYVPIKGRTKFTRRNYITQRLEISVLGGSDKAEDPEDDGGGMADYKDDVKSGDTDDPHSFNMGLNVGYSLVFVPGHIEGDRLKLNRFGFAYSLGFIASVDKQDKYGATCDLLTKIGVETGNGHAMGIGADLLVGSGTSPVTMCFDLGEDGEFTDYDTRWCLKYGFQLWVRSNLLHANIKNTDIRLFARYVTSIDPTDDNDFIIDGRDCGYYMWSPDSWQFGLTFCYNF